MMRERLNATDVVGGFLLDGYPRTTAQVNHLDVILGATEQTLDMVLELTADDDELVFRLLGRGKKEHRSDDNEAVIRHRLGLYHEQTQAVVANYSERGILRRIDGIGAPDEVTDRSLCAIQESNAVSRNISR